MGCIEDALPSHMKFNKGQLMSLQGSRTGAVEAQKFWGGQGRKILGKGGYP